MSDKFILTGIEIFGYHGDLPEERKLGQKFLVDLELNLDLSISGKSSKNFGTDRKNCRRRTEKFN